MVHLATLLIFWCIILSILFVFCFIESKNEEINIEDGIARLHPDGFNKLNQYKIFVKNVVYKFYFKDSRYGQNELLFTYVGYGDNYHRFDELYTPVMYEERMLARIVFVKVYGCKNDMNYITHNGKKILKITPAPEYAL